MKNGVTLVIFCALVGDNKASNEFTSSLLGIANISQTLINTSQNCFEDYSELGCFPDIEPWVSDQRPFPLPMSPRDINTGIYLYTRKYPNERFTVNLWKKISINGSDFEPDRLHTAFIIHGFLNSSNPTWVDDLKDAYLKNRDANVFIVDWSDGARKWNYLQVAANTRVVGAELKRFVEYLVDTWNLNPDRIHLIGHSLGAHVSAHAAKEVKKSGNTISRITALDPTQPGFEEDSYEVRLTKDDAEFIEVIHTNIRPAKPLSGFGMLAPTGSVDYYYNGGSIQPGCEAPPLDLIKLTNIADLGQISVELIYDWVCCSHCKSYLYYTEALQNNNCTFWGHVTDIFDPATNITSFDNFDSVLEKSDTCTLDKCSPVGLKSEVYPARGVFHVVTNYNSPFCQSNPKITERMEKLFELRSNE